jgi:hypothetical protein
MDLRSVQAGGMDVRGAMCRAWLLMIVRILQPL